MTCSESASSVEGVKPVTEFGEVRVEVAIPVAAEYLVDPDCRLASATDGLAAWAETAVVQLTNWHPADATLTSFLAHNTRSHMGRHDNMRGRGVSAIDIVEGRNRLLTFLLKELDAVANSDQPRLLRNSDVAGFEPVSAAEFVHRWNDELWGRLGEELLWRRDRRREPTPQQSGVSQPNSRKQSLEQSGDTTVKTQDPQPAPRTPMDADAVIAAVRRNLTIGGSAVYFGSVVPSLGRRVWGVDQATLQRRNGATAHATKPRQRMRIHVVARALSVACGLGDAPIGNDALHRLRRLAREALEPWCTPGALYQESRRAVAHVLYMLEQLFDADADTALAAYFGALLDEATTRKDGEGIS